MTCVARAPRPADVAAAFELRGRTRACAELLDVRAKDVLNVGSSIGWLEREALARGARSVVGIDVTPSGLEIARELAPAAEFREASVLALPFAAGSFDVVAMYDVIEHLPAGSELRALSEIRRVLRPDGRLGLSTPNRHWFATLTDPAYYFGHRHYRLPHLVTLLTEAGFALECARVTGRLFDQLDLLLYYAWRHLFRRERHPLELVRRLADREWQSDDGWNTLLVVAKP